MELREALGQIAEIRQQMARTELFRGYRSLTVGFSGVLALAAAALQPYLLDPDNQLKGFLVLWVLVAGVNFSMAAVQLWRRAQLAHSRLTRQATLLAAEQFLPSIVVGAVVTLCVYRYASDSAWMLPGLWSLIYSLGIFASLRLLPRRVIWVGLHYVAAGATCLIWGQGSGHSLLGRWPSVSGAGRFSGRRFCTGLWSAEMARRKSSQTGRFSYDGLDRVIHEKARLGILASLAAHGGGLLFNDLKELCCLTDGNLSRHLSVLSEAGLVEIWKGQQGARQQTMYRLTADGRTRFGQYISVLESVVSDAHQKASQQAAPLPGRLAPDLG